MSNKAEKAEKAEYLYGIVPPGGAKDFGPIGLDGGLVRTVSQGEAGILASESDRICFTRLAPEQTLQYLAQHQRVLEQVMRDTPVIPLKFGTYAEDGRHVLEILSSGRKAFAAALDKYAAKVEVDLAVFWGDLKAVLAEIADNQAVVSAMTGMADRSGPTTDERVRLGQLVKKLLDQRRDGLAEELTQVLKPRWADVTVHPARDDSMILNAALLIGRSEQAALESVIHDLDRRYGGRLNFRCVGPLPPYSFATVQVKIIDAARLDAARRTLGLGPSASLADIKGAYRLLLRQVHPDMNKDAEALNGDRMKEITEAYALLEEYFMNVRHAFNSTAGNLAIVTVRSVDDLRPSGGRQGSRRLDMAAVPAA